MLNAAIVLTRQPSCAPGLAPASHAGDTSYFAAMMRADGAVTASRPLERAHAGDADGGKWGHDELHFGRASVGEYSIAPPPPPRAGESVRRAGRRRARRKIGRAPPAAAGECKIRPCRCMIFLATVISSILPPHADEESVAAASSARGTYDDFLLIRHY